MNPYERRILERLCIDETSPSGLKWNKNARKRYKGKPAGTLGCREYWQVAMKINGKQKSFLAHRLVWFLANERWPEDQIDHINGDRSDNRISNLREASRGENMWNAASITDNSSGVKGVYFHKRSEKWRAQVMRDCKNIQIGEFASLDEATLAIRNVREKLHGEFANHGALLSREESA